MKVNVRGHVNTATLLLMTEKGTAKALRKAAAYTRKVAQNSIRKSKNPSVEGTPPHTRRGRLKKAILFYSDRVSAIIGPSSDVISEVGASHEYGLTIMVTGKRRKYKVGKAGIIAVGKDGKPRFAKLKSQAMAERATRVDLEAFPSTTKMRRFPKRAYMKPALDKVTPELEKFWKECIN